MHGLIQKDTRIGEVPNVCFSKRKKGRLPASASASARGAGVCIKSRQLQATCAKLFEALLE